MINEFIYCPKCGSKKVQTQNGKHWICPDCNFDLYNNVAAAVGIIIKDKDNNVLFEYRAKEPRKGFCCLPGGFVDADESCEHAIIRECQEEIGVQIGDVKYLASFPNVYPYKDFIYKTCDMFYVAQLSDLYKNMDDFIKKLKAQESEVDGFTYYRVCTKEDIEKIPLAFESAKKALSFFIGEKKYD